MTDSRPSLPSTLRLCVFNVENLFIGLEYWRGEPLDGLSEEAWRALALPQLRRWQKPLRKLWGLVEAIDDIAPDVLGLVEVGGAESLAHFAHHFLGDRYVALPVETNSSRGIDLGFLVRRGLSLAAKVRSNRDAPVELRGRRGATAGRFSRDVAELRLTDAAGALRLVLLLVHLKSKLSSTEDVRGKDLRTAEAFALARFYEALRAREPDAPIVVAGDFNAEPGSLELEAIARTDLVDARELAGIPPDERTTFVHFASGPDGVATEPRPSVLDHLLIAPTLRAAVIPEGTFTYRYHQEGIPRPLPRTYAERGRLPSDHYPVVATLRLPPLDGTA